MDKEKMAEELIQFQKKEIERLNAELESQKTEVMKWHKERILELEKNYEERIDQQYSEIQMLRTQLANRKDLEGRFYVFNPLHGQPRKIYDSYAKALADAKDVAKNSGQIVFVLKIISGVKISEIVEDYSIMPEEDIPF